MISSVALCREATANFPVQRDSGGQELLLGHRIQHSNALGPYT